MALDVTIGGTASDSYVTLAEYEAYVTAQGLTPLSGNAARHEAELRRAAVVIDDTYSFIGLQQYQFQARAWPRLVRQLVSDWPINPDTIPDAIKRAQMEMAWLIHGGADPFATYDGAVKRKREKVDVIEEETEYTGGKGRPMFTGVDRILRDYITSGAGQRRMVRG
jgi:hypothetical protein